MAKKDQNENCRGSGHLLIQKYLIELGYGA